MPFVEDQDLVVRQIDDVEWELLEPLTYVGKWETFVVDAGSRTDFASVPRPLVWLLPRYGRYTKAAVLHDHLCAGDVVSRVDADGIFRRAMRELGVPVVRRWMMWAAVRLAAMTRDPRHAAEQGSFETAKVAAVAAPSIAFLAAPFTVVSVWLGFFYLVELVAYWLAWLSNMLKPPELRVEVNPPELMWGMA